MKVIQSLITFTPVSCLGLVRTLTGLNIANNPLDFPPVEIIEGGVQTILAFFREMLRAKSQGKPLPGKANCLTIQYSKVTCHNIM